MLYATASQTVGPYLHIGLTGLNCADLTADAPALAGQRVVIEGRVIDAPARPCPMHGRDLAGQPGRPLPPCRRHT